jgi:8-hydroxy-5-deazaflavin:NADPH oxidoreductase
MTRVSIIGTGNMGSAIEALATKGGHTVETFDTTDKDKAVTGDVVVLAVPYGALDEIVAERGDQLAGKIVVDITNPVDFDSFDAMAVPNDSSAAAELAGKLPRSRVLKAFNTTFAGTLSAGQVGGELPTTVLIAGDDPQAKDTLATVVTASGLKAIDAGSLKRAREMEALGFLQLTLAAREKTSWTGGFGVTA